MVGGVEKKFPFLGWNPFGGVRVGRGSIFEEKKEEARRSAFRPREVSRRV